MPGSRDTLNNLILKSPQNWQTSVGLPFFQIQGTVVEWDEVRFDVRLMQRVPYEGVSRMQTSLRRRHRDRVVRRGLALIIESDFYATDAGRAHFADQLTSIRYCVQEVRARPRHAPRAAAAHARPGYLRRPATSTRSTLTCRRPTTTSPVRHTPHTPPWRLHARSHARRALCCADDRAKNLRPKRNIKTAMNNGARVCDF